MSARTHQLVIRTPEGVRFSLALAGPISRCLAWLLDAACISIASKTAASIIGIFGALSPDVSMALTIVLFFIINTVYAIALEWFWQGQTLGKRVMGLRVIDIRGLRLTLNQIIMRNLLRAVDSLPFLYLVGGAATLLNRYGQRLGDIAANTVVIKEAGAVEPDLENLMSRNGYNSLRSYPHIVARLRQQIQPEEAGLALQALVRRNDLAPEARVGVFDEIADYFKAKTAFPPEATDGVSSEQYVRNVVDVLYRSRGR